MDRRPENGDPCWRTMRFYLMVATPLFVAVGVVLAVLKTNQPEDWAWQSWPTFLTRLVVAWLLMPGLLLLTWVEWAVTRHLKKKRQK